MTRPRFKLKSLHEEDLPEELTRESFRERRSSRPMTNIEEASEITFEMRWRGRRCEHSRRSHMEMWKDFFERIGRKNLDDITTRDLLVFVREEEARGNKGSTLAKLSCLRTIVKTALELRPAMATKELPKISVKLSRPLKWWLTPEDQISLLAHLRTSGEEDFADLVEFIVWTGVRIEEALRFTPSHFTGLGTLKPSMTVPGTKTKSSQAALPLFARAAEIALKRSKGLPKGSPLFSFTYIMVWARWEKCREFLGVKDISTATMKNLRRSFGRVATSKGMPTEILRLYYRHSTIETTVSYLRLVGGEQQQEMIRQWTA